MLSSAGKNKQQAFYLNNFKGFSKNPFSFFNAPVIQCFPVMLACSRIEIAWLFHETRGKKLKKTKLTKYIKTWENN